MIRHIKENKVYSLVVCFFAFYYIIQTVGSYFDNDFYHIANSGKWIVENGRVPTYNETFILEGYKTITQQWLYSVMLYDSYAIGGQIGVFTLTLLQVLVLIWCIYKFAVIKGVDKRNTLFVIVATNFILDAFFNCRPQLISIVLLLLQCIIVEYHKQSKNNKILYVLPLLMLAEINLHCTFWVFHYIFLLPYFVPLNKILFNKTKIADSNLNIKPFIVPMALMGAVMFINPYGLTAILCLLYSGGISRLNIAELKPLPILNENLLFIISVIICMVWLYKKGKLTSTTVYFFAGTTLLNIMAIRNQMFFAFGMLYIICDILSGVDLSKFYDYFNKTTRKDIAVFVIAIAVFVVMIIIGVSQGKHKYLTNTPTDIVEYLQENEEISDIRLFTDFNTGAYFKWQGVGKIYLEPKTEPYIEAINGKEDIIEEYVYIKKYADKEGIEQFLEKYAFDYLFVPTDFTALGTYLELSDNYECVYVGKNSDTKDYPNYEIPIYKLYKRVGKGQK